jgi:hypothetical protein
MGLRTRSRLRCSLAPFRGRSLPKVFPQSTAIRSENSVNEPVDWDDIALNEESIEIGPELICEIWVHSG